MKKNTPPSKHSGLNNFYNKAAAKVTKATGSPVASISALLLILLWAIGGLIFGFSDTWQLLINTTTTIITFLMVFVIQQSQNKDTMAIQLKLNELIACNENASNRLIDIEDLTEAEIETIKMFYEKLSKLSGSENHLYATHSLDEAAQLNDKKITRVKITKKKKDEIV